MKKTNFYIPVLSLVLFIGLSSCEEVIDINLNSVDPVLVAEGYMELDSLCSLRLTYTSDYFHEESPVSVENAVVTLTDQNGTTETLRHMGDGMYHGLSIRGAESSKYVLSIETEEQYNTGFSSLNPVPVFDSYKLEDFPLSKPFSGQEPPKILTISFRNDPERAEYYMLRLKVNGVLDGDSFSLASDKNSRSSETVTYSTRIQLTGKSDTLSLEAYAIDEDTYRYYSQLNESIGGGMALSSTPYNPASNLGEGILGYFMARSRHDTTIIISNL